VTRTYILTIHTKGNNTILNTFLATLI